VPDKKCPRCGLWSTGSALRCDCGYDFEKGTIEESYIKDPSNKDNRKMPPYEVSRMSMFFSIVCGAVASIIPSSFFWLIPSSLFWLGDWEISELVCIMLPISILSGIVSYFGIRLAKVQDSLASIAVGLGIGIGVGSIGHLCFPIALLMMGFQ
jgi:hypothetical protein